MNREDSAAFASNELIFKTNQKTSNDQTTPSNEKFVRLGSSLSQNKAIKSGGLSSSGAFLSSNQKKRRLVQYAGGQTNNFMEDGENT